MTNEFNNEILQKQINENNTYIEVYEKKLNQLILNNKRVLFAKHQKSKKHIENSILITDDLNNLKNKLFVILDNLNLINEIDLDEIDDLKDDLKELNQIYLASLENLKDKLKQNKKEIKNIIDYDFQLNDFDDNSYFINEFYSIKDLILQLKQDNEKLKYQIEKNNLLKELKENNF